MKAKVLRLNLRSAILLALSDLFFRLHKVERIGMGIQKMKESMFSAGLRMPEFQPHDFFKAIFYRSADFSLNLEPDRANQDLVSNKPMGSEKSSEKSSEKILAYLTKYRAASAREIAAAIGLSQRAVEKRLAKLKANGILLRMGPDKGGHWLIVK